MCFTTIAGTPDADSYNDKVRSDFKFRPRASPGNDAMGETVSLQVGQFLPRQQDVNRAGLARLP
jgi:hypothetical protein